MQRQNGLTGDPPEMLTESLLEQLEKRLRELNAPVADRLRPGLTASEIETLAGPIGLRLPIEAQRWWGWHNGVHAEPGTLASQVSIGFSVVLSLEQAIDVTLQRRELAKDVADDLYSADDWWHPGWLVLTQVDSLLSCDCSVPPEQPSPIRSAGHGAQPDELQAVRARSLGELVSGWLEAIDCGAWAFADGRWHYEFARLPAHLQRSLWS